MKKEQIASIIDTIYIEKEAENLPAARIITSNLPQIPVKIISDIDSFLKNKQMTVETIPEGKRNLIVAIQKGRFYKLCPGTKNYLCCLYKIIHQASNCPMDCAYCILQIYFNNPYLMFYANEDAMFNELDEVLSAEPERIFRIGTGEFTDSLVLDPVTEFSKRLIPFMQNYKNAYLELKTKSVNIEFPLIFKSNGRIFMAWSVNPEEIIDQNELEAAKLEDRLKAARKCQEAGFPVCFHFDPIIRFPGWKEAYSRTIAKIFSYVDPAKIVWISMGCMRFPVALKDIISKRFPGNKIAINEFFPGNDMKMRYFKPLRIEMFDFIYKEIRKYSNDPLVYFCMESEEIWNKVLGWAPADNEEFSAWMDKRCKIFG